MRRLPLIPEEKVEELRPKNLRSVLIALNQIASEMQAVDPYKTIKRGEPPIRKKPDIVNKSTDSQRKRSIIHALTRANAEGFQP